MNSPFYLHQQKIFRFFNLTNFDLSLDNAYVRYFSKVAKLIIPGRSYILFSYFVKCTSYKKLYKSYIYILRYIPVSCAIGFCEKKLSNYAKKGSLRKWQEPYSSENFYNFIEIHCSFGHDTCWCHGQEATELLTRSADQTTCISGDIFTYETVWQSLPSEHAGTTITENILILNYTHWHK